jgi:uncharacterized protein (DUF983 family)
MDALFASNSGDDTVSNSFSARLLNHEIVRGLFGRCPCCGKGRLFGAFLKVKDHCEVCGEELHHHRADDFPAYVVILIVGHLLVPAVLSVETHFAPPYWVHLALWLPPTLILTLGLLQPVKGAIVALQWHMGMHGFEEAKLARARRDAGRTCRDGAEPTEHDPDVHRRFDLTEENLLRLQI